MSMQNDNPFKAPAARVSDYQEPIGASEFALAGNRLPAGAGWAWIKGGWALFKQAPGTWIGLILLAFVLMIVISLTSKFLQLGNLALSLLSPILIGGIMHGCKALDTGEGLKVSHLVACFSSSTGPLLIVGLLSLVSSIAFNSAVGLGWNGAVAPRAGVMNSTAVLLGVFAFIPVAMATWFASPLIALNNVAPVAALKASFLMALRNFLPVFICGLCFIPLGILSVIPIGLGIFVLVPVLYASQYVSYKAIFLRPSA